MEKFGLCNARGERLLNTEYDSIEAAGKDYKDGYIIEKDNEFGYSTFSGKTTNIEFEEVIKIPNVNIVKVKREGKVSYIIDGQENALISSEYEEGKDFATSNNFIVKKDGKWVVIDKENKVVLDKYDDYLGINDNDLIVQKDNKIGTVNLKTESKIEVIYEQVEHVFDNNYIVKQNENYGIANTDNKLKIDIKYKNIVYRKEAGIIECDTDIYNKQFVKGATRSNCRNKCRQSICES